MKKFNGSSLAFVGSNKNQKPKSQAGRSQNRWLELANRAFRDTDYSAAASYYKKAAHEMPELSKYIQFNIERLIAERSGTASAESSEASQRVIVYTCNFGAYESVKEPLNVDPNVRYILFTDDPHLQSDIWEVKWIDTYGMPASRASRLPKLLPHKYLPEHDVSIYLDSSLTITSQNIFQDILPHLGNAKMALYGHFSRDCTYSEIEECISLGKVSKSKARAYARTIKSQDFPKRFGLLENAFIVRENCFSIKVLNEFWFDMYCHGEPRDQFYLMYALWKTETPFSRIDDARDFRRSPHLVFTSHRHKDEEAKTKQVFKPTQYFGKNGLMSLRLTKDKARLERILAGISGSILKTDLFEGKRTNLFKFAVRVIAEMEAVGMKDAHHLRRQVSYSALRDYETVFAQRRGTKIGYIPSSSMPTAAANNVHVMKMCSALMAEGCRIGVYATQARGEQCLDVSNIHEYFGVNPSLQINLIQPEKTDAQTAANLVFSALADGCDRIFTRSLDVAVIAGLADIPCVLELHKELSDEGWHKLNFVIRSASFEGLVLITEALARRFRGVTRDLDKKIFVFPDAADEPVVAKEPFGLSRNPQAKLNVGYVGHLYPGKGAELAVKLAREISYVHFHMLGGLPEDVAHWKEETRDLDNITFYGHYPPSKVPSFINEVDVAIAPFLRQVGVNNGKHNIASVFSPLKMFEYMALGKPIVCSDLPVIREVLVHKHNALLCNPDSLPEWKAAFDLLISNSKIGSKLGWMAKCDFLEKYTWRRRARRALEILNPKFSFESGVEKIRLLSQKTSLSRKPVVKWFFGGKKQSGWAYGINAKRISKQIPDCIHIFDDEQSDLIPDVAIAFDVLIKETDEFKNCGARRKVMRVGGPNPLKVLSGGDEGILKEKLRDLDAIICLSPQLRDYVSRFHDHVYFVPNGIDLNVFNPKALVPKTNEDKLVVGMSASMTNDLQKEVKGYYYALEACQEIDAELFVVGRGFSHIEHDRLIEDFYSKIDVLVHPVGPGKEASSNVIMEALALGIPVVTTRYSGFHGVALEHGKSALIVERNTLCLATSLKKLKNNSEAVSLMRYVGYEFVQSHHDLMVVAGAYESILLA